MDRSRLWMPALATLLGLAACATLDDFLEIPLGEGPAVVLAGRLQPADHDTLVVAGVDDAEVIDGVQYRTLHLFLHATGEQGVAAGMASRTTYLPLAPIAARQFPDLVAALPELAGLDLFALRLQGMRLAADPLAGAQTLRDAGLRNMSPRQIAMVAARRIAVATQPLDPLQSEQYAARLGAVFAGHGDLP